MAFRGWILFVLSLAFCDAAVWESYDTNFPQTDPNRYIVKFAGDSNLGKATLSSLGATIIHDHPLINAATVSLPSTSIPQIADSGHIEFMERDVPRWLMSGGSQVTPYGISLVQANQLPQGSSQHTVCIIDSGIDLGHEDFAGLVVSGFGSSSNYGTDGCNHGTHVAGTIAARDNTYGVIGAVQSSNVQLYIVRVFADNCTWVYASDLMSAASNCLIGPQITISMSLGCANADPTQCASTAEQQFFDTTYSNGHLNVAAAGNAGTNWFTYPASYPSVISVAAVDHNKVHATFSQTNNAVEISAPGVSVYSTFPRDHGQNLNLTVNGVSYAVINFDASPFIGASGPLFNCGTGATVCGDGSTAQNAICLIQRSAATSPLTQIENCEDGGGVGAIIYNNVPGLWEASLDNTATNVPGVSLSQADGTTLLGLIGQTAVLSTAPHNADYNYLDGTSMATPHVSGVLANVWSQNSAWTNVQLRTVMQNTAILCSGQTAKDNNFGYGLIQAFAMYTALIASSPIPSSTAPPSTTSPATTSTAFTTIPPITTLPSTTLPSSTTPGTTSPATTAAATTSSPATTSAATTSSPATTAAATTSSPGTTTAATTSSPGTTSGATTTKAPSTTSTGPTTASPATTTTAATTSSPGTTTAATTAAPATTAGAATTSSPGTTTAATTSSPATTSSGATTTKAPSTTSSPATTTAATTSSPATTTTAATTSAPATTTAATTSSPATTTTAATTSSPATTTTAATTSSPATTSPAATTSSPATTTSATTKSPSTTTTAATTASPATTAAATTSSPATTTTAATTSSPATTTAATTKSPSTTTTAATTAAPATTTTAATTSSPATTTSATTKPPGTTTAATTAPATTAPATTPTPSPNGNGFIGCYDDMVNRDLNGTWTNSASMTPAFCSAFCTGYAYFGVQLGQYCFCGNSFGRYGTATDCGSPCAGNTSLICGGFWANSVYQRPPTLLGCYDDMVARDLNGTFTSSALMTPAFCQNFCFGYTYFGVQLGQYCFCGNSFDHYGTSTACGTPCAGNATLTCGGFWANDVYGYP